MSDVRTLIATAAAGFDERVRRIPPSGWAAPSACADWSVRDLTSHVTSEHLWVPHLLAGERLEQVGNRYDGDVLGDDPVAAWAAASERSLAAWSQLEDIDRPVQLSSGEQPAREYGEQLLMDLTVHTWDLARGLGLDPALDRGCVEHVLAYVEEHQDELRGSGLFGEPVDTQTEDSQDRLLGMLGRRP